MGSDYTRFGPELSQAFLGLPVWEFPKIRGTLFWGPYNNDPTNSSTILGSPIFGNSRVLACVYE